MRLLNDFKLTTYINKETKQGGNKKQTKVFIAQFREKILLQNILIGKKQ
jgi:hypothetical protein